jgi:hypothetical protein
MEDKACLDCKHGDRHKILRDLMCWHPRFQKERNDKEIPLREKGNHRKGSLCLLVRNNDAQCGPEGRWWEPKMNLLPLELS